MDIGDLFLSILYPTLFIFGLIIIEDILIGCIMLRNLVCYILNRTQGTKFKIINVKEFL